jgi:hypothetical protein
MADTLEGFRTPAPDPTQPVTTMDGTADGRVAPAGIEPSDAPAPAPAGPAPAPTPDEKTIAKMVASKRYKDEGRSAIFERRNAMTLEERQELENLDAESAAILEAHAGQPRAATVSTAPLAPREPGAPVEPVQAAAPGPVAPVAAPGAPIAPTPVASNERRYKLQVYGVEQEASEDVVIAAGIQALQKQHAADARMQDAATYEARLTAWQNQLQAYADDLQRRTSTVPGQAQPGTAGNPAPTPGGAAAVDPATVQQAMEAMENLDSAKAAQLMQKAINDAVAQGRAPAPAPAPAAPSQTGGVPRLPTAASDPWDNDQRSAANRVFNTEFAHFTDAQFNAAKAAVDEAMADPANRGQDLGTIVRSVCRTTQRFVAATPAPAPAAPANPTADELARRQVLKARIPVTPPAASMRSATSAAPEVRYPSGSEYVQQLRSRSGSNSSR